MLQLSDRRKPPIRVPGQPQIAAVFHRLFPGHVSAVVLRCPHESGGGIDPISAHLSVLRRPDTCRYHKGKTDGSIQQVLSDVCRHAQKNIPVPVLRENGGDGDNASGNGSAGAGTSPARLPAYGAVSVIQLLTPESAVIRPEL